MSCACLALQNCLCNTTPLTVGSHRQLHKQSVSHGWHRDKCQMNKGNQLCPADEQQQGWSHALRSQHGRRQAACASVCWLPPQEVGRHGSDQRNAQTNSEPCAEWHCPAALLGSGGSGWGVGGAQQRGLLHRVFQRCLGGVGDRIGGAAQVKRSSHGCMACMYSRAANAVVERQSVGCHAHVFITDSFHHVSKETNELYFMHPLMQKSTCSPFALPARPLGAACRRLPPLSAGCRRPQVAPCQGARCSTHDGLMHLHVQVGQLHCIFRARRATGLRPGAARSALGLCAILDVCSLLSWQPGVQAAELTSIMSPAGDSPTAEGSQGGSPHAHAAVQVQRDVAEVAARRQAAPAGQAQGEGKEELRSPAAPRPLPPLLRPRIRTCVSPAPFCLPVHAATAQRYGPRCVMTAHDQAVTA